jgi:hypothetical protein
MRKPDNAGHQNSIVPKLPKLRLLRRSNSYLSSVDAHGVSASLSMFPIKKLRPHLS